MSSACTQCGRELDRGERFCIDCGAPRPQAAVSACTGCGAELPAATKFCIECGAPASPAAAPPSTPAPAGPPSPPAPQAPPSLLAPAATESPPPPASPAVPAAVAPEPPSARPELTPEAAAATTPAGGLDWARLVRDPRVLGGVAAALVVVVLGWFVLLRGDQPGSAATGAAAEQAAGGTPAAGAGTPAASGEAGQEARATPTGELVAWTAAFDVVTRPAGARVVIDGVAVDGLTPLQIELDSQTRYDIRIGLEGYEPVRWAFTPGELPEATQASRRLYFPLTAMEAASAIASPTRSGSEVPAAPPAPGADMDGVERPVEPPSTPRGRDESPLDPIRVSGARMTAPTVLEKVDPEFPDWARDAGLPTYVLLQLIIDRNGSLRSSQVLRPVHPDLERVALKVVQQWRFAPATRDGEPVDAYFNVSVTFVRE